MEPKERPFLEPDDAAPAPVANSRRDFLRRAGKQAAREAAELGTKIVPGAALAKRFLAAEKRDDEPEPDDDALALDLSHPPGAGKSADVPPPAPSPLTDPLGWLAAWRKKRE